MAGISLLVGGIGIMNIMLASISERIRDRHPQGGRRWRWRGVHPDCHREHGDCCRRGLLGLATSFGFIRLITFLTPTDNAPVVTVGAMALAFSASAGIGRTLRRTPSALRAARMNVIQSLRYD